MFFTGRELLIKKINCKGSYQAGYRTGRQQAYNK